MVVTRNTHIDERTHAQIHYGKGGDKTNLLPNQTNSC